MRPDPKLLDSLVTARYRLNRARASVAVGERRSPALGAGMEFAEHRPYREGDDVRHLDPRLFARLGENYIRQYFVDRQAPVYVLLDHSASMLTGDKNKQRTATLLAQLFGFLALTSGDRVEIGHFGADRLQWSPRFSGKNRAELLFSWISDRPAGGSQGFGEALRQAPQRLKPRSLVILISDFLDEDVVPAIRAMGAAGHDLVMLQVLSPEDTDPSLHGQGPMRLADAETGQTLELAISPAVLRKYEQALNDWQNQLRDIMRANQGRFFVVPSTTDLSRFIQRDLTASGLI